MDRVNTGTESTGWSPERKIVGGAVAVLVLALVAIFFEVDLPVGTEGALGILVAYFLPNKKSA